MTARRFDALNELESKASARIVQARKRALYALEETAPMIVALRTLRREDPQAATLALHDVRALLANLLREIERP